ILPVGGGDERQSARRAEAGDGVFEGAGRARTSGKSAARTDKKRLGRGCEGVGALPGATGNGARKHFDYPVAANCTCVGNGSGETGAREKRRRSGDGRACHLARKVETGGAAAGTGDVA